MLKRIFLFVCVVCYFFSLVDPTKKKVCADDVLPELNMTVPQLIRYFGYPAEIHRVQTDDGYILTMHRIPYGRNNSTSAKFGTRRQPIFLQHGLVSNSEDWLMNMPNESLGFILADSGYDVWMGNVRGNAYSQLHVDLTKDDRKFWDFSWQQMAEFDLPAMVNYVLNKTENAQLVYIGHSQGSLIGFAKFSTDLVFSKKIKQFIALAPISTVGHITSPVRAIAPFSFAIRKTIDVIGDFSLGSVDWVLDYLKPACDLIPLTEMLCENALFYIVGPESKKLINQTRLPLFLAQNPDDTSMKNIVHFGQMVLSGQMQMYNYGYWKNWRNYGQFTPPTYNVKNMLVDTVAFWSPKDAFADVDDVSKLLPKIKHLRSYRIDDYSHLDFMWALNAREKVYSTILNLLATA